MSQLVIVSLHMGKGNTSTGKAKATTHTKGLPKKAALKKAPTKKAPTKKSQKTSFVSSRVFYLITIYQSILINALTCFVRYMKDGLADQEFGNQKMSII